MPTDESITVMQPVWEGGGALTVPLPDAMDAALRDLFGQAVVGMVISVRIGGLTYRCRVEDIHR